MRHSSNSAVRAIDIAISFVEREEQRLRGIMESETASKDEKFRALRDLAYLSGMVIRELADLQFAEREQPPESVESAADAGSAEAPGSRTRRHRRYRNKRTPLPDEGSKERPEGVYFVDKERRITYWNTGAEDIAGFKRDEAVGRYCYQNFLKHEDERGTKLCLAGCPLAATLKDGKAREAEVTLHHKLGHIVPVSVRVSPVVDVDGKLIGAVEVFSPRVDPKPVQN